MSIVIIMHNNKHICMKYLHMVTNCINIHNNSISIIISMITITTSLIILLLLLSLLLG